MRFKKWLGLFSNSSPYTLPAGANRKQVNLQSRTVGQLNPRGGIVPVPSTLLVDNFAGILPFSSVIFSLYRGVRTGLSDYLIGAVANNGVAQIVNLTTQTTLKSGGFTTDAPVCICQDRHGTFYFFQGFGGRPQRWSGSNANVLVDLGIPAPDANPAVERDSTAGSGYYIERVNVVDGGASYWQSPAVTITGTLSSGGTPARLRAVVEAGTVAAVEVLEHGSRYTGPVTITFDPDAAATNTFAATATLATDLGPGQFGMTSASPASITGMLTAGHTVAVGGDNQTINTFTLGNTSGTSVQHYEASLSNGQWTATGVRILRSTDFTDSGARATVVFSNSTFTYQVGSLYGLALMTATNDGYNPSNFAAGQTLNIASQVYVEAPSPTLPGYPQVRIVDSAGNLLQKRPVRWYANVDGKDQFYFIMNDPGGATVRVYLTSQGTLTAPPEWGNHPDKQAGQYYLPDAIGYRLAGTNWTYPIIANPQGNGYTASDHTIYLARFNTNLVQQPIETSLTFSTQAVAPNNATINMPRELQSWTITNPGTAWSSGQTGYIQFASRPDASNDTPAPASYSAAQKLTLTVVETEPGQQIITGSVASVNVTDGASNLLVPPTILFSGTGYGLELQASVVNGSIPLGTAGITVINGGAGFAGPPSLSIRTGGAQATAVMRPTMVGKYQCAYRYVDNSVPPESGGPIYSSFSPISELDAGPALGYTNTNAATWTLAPAQAIPARATGVELWRTSSDQALVFYRVAAISDTTPGNVFTDTLNDEQLFDPDRDQYAALPVVLPNGELNAYRFGQPRTDMSACVAFQDRLFYGVSTSGSKINSIFYSEFDEFESCPDINEVTIQQNVRQPDQLSALAPFGGQLMAFQKFHCYSLTYLEDPSVDGNLQLVAFRGCLNQQCWEIYDGLLYAVDERGVYSLSAGGDVQDLSMPIHDLFEIGLPASASGLSDNFIHLKIDPITQILRVFLSLPGDAVIGEHHPAAVCFSLETKSWWVERYPQRIACSGSLKTANNRVTPVYGCNQKVFYLDSGYSDHCRNTITQFTITNPGSGYTEPPEIVVGGGFGHGGVFQAVLNDTGGVKAIVVKNGGVGYVNGSGFTTSGGGGSGCVGTVTSIITQVVDGVASPLSSTPWYFQTGNAELITDRENPRNGGQQSRAVALTYRPTQDSRNVHLRLYYNNSEYPRVNFARRDRGTGFVEDIVADSSVLNMKSDRTEIGATSTGVSIARFAGRGIDDTVQTDRHVAVEISSDGTTSLAAPEPEANAAVIYEIDLQGVIESA